MAAPQENRAIDTIVNDDLGYPIAVGSRLEASIAAFVHPRYRHCVVVCDEEAHVARKARSIARRLRVPLLAFALGEKRKRLRTVERVLDGLVGTGADRDTLIVGVGGGVASDTFGLAAALYMRGVPYAHVATSLVAMVDAAVGGKTGVDLTGGKNLAGVFADPRAVFCDVAMLDTLPLRCLREGLAEVLKAAIIEGDALFERLEVLAAHPFRTWPWTELIADAVKVKTAIVGDDRLEDGVRETLNLGHTFGHAIEQATGYRVTHGAAVALGLRAAGSLALRTGRFSQTEHLRVLTLLALLGMPLRTSAEPAAVMSAMAADKKRRSGRLRFVLPRAIGDVEYGVTCSQRSVRAVLETLRHEPGTIAPES